MATTIPKVVTKDIEPQAMIKITIPKIVTKGTELPARIKITVGPVPETVRNIIRRVAVIVPIPGVTDLVLVMTLDQKVVLNQSHIITAIALYVVQVTIE